MRKLAADWAVEAWNRIPEDVIYNAWRHLPLSYFPDEPTRPCDFATEEDEYYRDCEMAEEDLEGVEPVGI